MAHVRKLMQQVERIADEAEDDQVQVIVQMESKDDLTDYFEATAEALKIRRSVISARDLMPPKKDEIKVSSKTGKLTPSTKKKLQASFNYGDRNFYAGFAIELLSENDLIDLGRQALQPLLESKWLQEIVGKPSPPKGGAAKGEGAKLPGGPINFWSSNSLVLELSKDELTELPAQDFATDVVNLYPNRIVRVPPVFEEARLPAAVEDHRAYTWGLERTGALACWGLFGAKGRDIKIAVLDTGVDPDHPDLKGKIADFAEFAPNGAIIKEGKQHAYDSGRHGTHCAGTIVGGNNSGRSIGMAPEAQILAGLVLPKGVGRDAQILAGIEWAIEKEADVISMSLGGLEMNPTVFDVYTRAIINANRRGVPVVVAVGNEGSQTSGSPGNDYFAFTVGATDVQDRAAGFSGGRTQIIEESRYIHRQYLPVIYSKPELVAPGVSIYSSVPGGEWEAWNGTSMATPHVAGAIAILLSSPSTIKSLTGVRKVNLIQQLLTSTVDELGESGQDHRYGFGLVNVLRAFGYAQELGYV